MLLAALPVPLIFVVPVRVRFSTLAGRVVVTLAVKVSLMVTIPLLLVRVALMGLLRLMAKVSFASLRLSLRMGMVIVAVEVLRAMVRVPVLLV